MQHFKIYSERSHTVYKEMIFNKQYERIRVRLLAQRLQSELSSLDSIHSKQIECTCARSKWSLNI